MAHDTVTIPTGQEVLIKGRVCTPEDEGIAHGLVEPDEKLMAKGTLVGRTLVTADRVVPIRIFNFSPECRTIYIGTHLAEMSSVCVVQTKEKTKATSALPEMLEDLLRQRSADLTDDQRSTARDFLQQYSHAFALSNADLGTMEVVEHEIKVGKS